MKRVQLLVIVIISGFIISSCSTTNMFMESKNEKDASVEALDSIFFYNPEYQYIIRKDDKINISVWGQDDLSVGSIYGIYNSNAVYGKWLMVDAEGNIEIPKIGTTNVIGKTVIELKRLIKSELGRSLVNPIVDVKVLNREISVVGEVIKPQSILVDKDVNYLLEVISKCEGFDRYANLKYIKVLRQVGPDVYVANVDISKPGDYLFKNLQLHPGDMVVVPSKNYKEFDYRISNIIPFATTLTAAAIFMGAF